MGFKFDLIAGYKKKMLNVKCILNFDSETVKVCLWAADSVTRPVQPCQLSSLHVFSIFSLQIVLLRFVCKDNCLCCSQSTSHY